MVVVACGHLVCRSITPEEGLQIDSSAYCREPNIAIGQRLEKGAMNCKNWIRAARRSRFDEGNAHHHLKFLPLNL
ncbi:hypothetical protein OUZ56_029268 [Daphnia magna]|uniref:Uncharacterized protein n=1 Tax=Daphnia magna TaxID=35525 RepID=A0ABR0B6D1_9CRUS|nr:hypothetical protein OUZ56_029268 [Daphnia magna]